jgi:hypothetical protein
MRLKIITVDLQLGRGAKRVLVGAAVAIATASLGTSVVLAAVPNEFAPGDVLTAASLNENFADLDGRIDASAAETSALEQRIAALEAAASAPRTRVELNAIAPFTVASGVYEPVPYTGLLHDDKDEFDPVSATFMPDDAGDYLVCAAFTMNNANVAFTELYLYVNDTRGKAFAGPYSDYALGCTTVRLAAGDELQVRVRQSSGSTLGVSTSDYWTGLSIYGLS